MNQKAEHWRRLAQHARLLAGQHDPETKKTLLEIAVGYEQLAVIEGKLAARALLNAMRQLDREKGR